MGEMDVFAGIVGSDGHIYKDKLTVCVTNKNKEFMESRIIPLIRRITGKNRKAKFVSSGFGEGKFKVHVSSVKLCRMLIEKYNIPAGAKAYSIKPPDLYNLESKVDFLRGWIAGDGSVTRDRTRVKIEIWSKSLPMMEWFRDVLSELKVNCRMFKEKKKNEHILRVGRKNDVKLFHEKVEIPHPDKQEKFERLMFQASRPLSN
jgi:intein-encoded DNA endonuclease-like protein